MKIDITLEEAYARASKGLRRKMEYSINLLQRAEKLALAYDNRGGYFSKFLPTETLWYGIGTNFKPLSKEENRRLRVHPAPRPDTLERENAGFLPAHRLTA